MLLPDPPVIVSQRAAGTLIKRSGSEMPRDSGGRDKLGAPLALMNATIAGPGLGCACGLQAIRQLRSSRSAADSESESESLPVPPRTAGLSASGTLLLMHKPSDARPSADCTTGPPTTSAY